MADYYDALASAVANLDTADQQARYAFYDRARRLVLERLQGVDPPLADAAIRAEMAAFNAAIRQLESDIVRPPKPAPAPPPPEPLEIPPELVGEETPPVEAIETPADAEPDPGEEPEAPEAIDVQSPPFEQTPRDRNLLRYGLAAGAAVIVVAALAYFLTSREERPPVQSAGKPAATSAVQQPPARGRQAGQQQAVGENMPYVLRRQLVYYRSTHPVGTLVIAKSQNFLYVVRPNSTAMRYTIGIGPDSIDAMGLYQISRKNGGTDGPAPPTKADVRAIYLGDDTKYRILQTQTPIVIGRRLTSPGFQLLADDFSDLYNSADLGTRVVVTN